MISSLTELRMQRRITEQFIDSDPITVIFLRAPRTPNGTGGFTIGLPVPLLAQKAKLIPANRQLQERQTLDGQVVQPDFSLVGLYDMDIQHGDWFLWSSRRYDVVYVSEKRDYETTAELVYRG